jgi:hypothetical protein
MAARPLDGGRVGAVFFPALILNLLVDTACLALQLTWRKVAFTHRIHTFRALDVLPGVVATGEFSNFSVRGNGPRDNLITVDGIPFDKVVHFDESLGEQEEIDGGGRYSIFAPNVIGAARFSPGGWRASEGGKNGSLLELELAEPNEFWISQPTR